MSFFSNVDTSNEGHSQEEIERCLSGTLQILS